MKKKILFIEKSASARLELQRAIAGRADLFAVSDPEEALDACRTMGAIAVAVAEIGIANANAFELLKRIREAWPETVGILLAPASDTASVARAIRDPNVFRCVTTPSDPTTLLASLEAALFRSAQIEAQEVAAEQVGFCKEAMESMTALLEERLDRHTSVVRRLHRFALELNAAPSARGIGKLVAGAASEALGGRGVQVQLFQATHGGEDVGAGAGREMSPSWHRTPIVVGAQEVGEICVDLFGPRGESLSAQDLALVDSIACNAAVAVHHEIARRDVQRAQHATVLALARLAERRDMETGRHLERVSSYCRIVAESLRQLGRNTQQLTDQFIEDLACSSPLHDIGKVGVPDSILLKPGKLSPEEWEIMKTHAAVGGTTLDEVRRAQVAASFLAMGSEIAWCHHEKWDGSGYPRGLLGEQIPLSARIVAIADVYDALTTIRPYKPAWPHADAVEWILAHSGSHFDPAVVAAFSSRLDEFDRVRTSLGDAREESAEALELVQQA